jgi:alpha-galactosidase
MAKKITIIGGGSSTFVPQLMRFFLDSKVLEGSTIVLMDVDQKRLDVMDTLCRQLVKLQKSSLKIESTTDQRASLDGADFVIGSISVGGMDAWEKDIEIPARHGIIMPIADSIGPGGIMRAFRHIPVLASVCEDLEEVSPDAWVFNYSNPATSNVIGMNMVSDIRVAGLCTCSSIPRNAAYLAAMAGAEPEDMMVPAPAAGLNHCAAITDLRFKDGSDALAAVLEKASESVTKWGLETYGVLPYCWSHWTEFIPGLMRVEDKYEGRAQGLRMQHNLHVHDMDHERERSAHWADLAAKLASGEQELSLNVLPEDEAIEVVEIIEDIIENRNAIHVVNVINGGAISNLPEDAVVEVSSVVNGYGISPMNIGEIPEAWAAVLRSHITCQELTAEAALTGDYDIALQAYLTDPTMAARLTPAETKALLDEMLAAHAAYLPQFSS